jgi:hypothetical protein
MMVRRLSGIFIGVRDFLLQFVAQIPVPYRGPIALRPATPSEPFLERCDVNGFFESQLNPVRTDLDIGFFSFTQFSQPLDTPCCQRLQKRMALQSFIGQLHVFKCCFVISFAGGFERLANRVQKIFLTQTRILRVVF